MGKPVRAFFDLRDQVRPQLLLLANVAPPKPRETISTSLEIQQYDEAQRILRDLGSQMLAFSESEIAACNGIATFGFDAVAAGRGLIALSNTYYRNMTDRADFSSKIEEALRFFKARGRQRTSRNGRADRCAAPVTLASMATELNGRGIRSARGGKWHRSSVANLLDRTNPQA